MLPAPPGYHWECVGYACVPASCLAPGAVCRSALKRSDGKRCACEQRSCCDLAERNARLLMGGAISQHRFQELSEDLRAHCGFAHLYEQWLLQHPELPLRKRARGALRKTLKERRAALKQWLTRSEPVSSSSGTS